MPFMLVRLECKYGKTQEFQEIMSHLVPVLEAKGWRLHGAYQNSIGRLNRCYDLWEMPDANARQLRPRPRRRGSRVQRVVEGPRRLPPGRGA